MVPTVAATSLTSRRSSPCVPMMTTSSPGEASIPVTSIIIMSMHTEPTTRARRPRTSTQPRFASRVSMPSA